MFQAAAACSAARTDCLVSCTGSAWCRTDVLHCALLMVVVAFGSSLHCSSIAEMTQLTENAQEGKTPQQGPS